ncbi:class I SAM-dependent methyltransferase [Streptomyces sp. NY05-11A]|uniref:class I SAM-dependent methyltransferase n=1 Tax=Streptomyces soliscabiei TaxID=588897 RepID=UPI0029BF8EC0|nr:class I SAM-dependent methyltransferase [Streptomyces sp. NY05-11A]
MDVGCGDGLLARKLAGRAKHVTGIDMSPDMIARARAFAAGDPRLTFVEGDFLAAELSGIEGPGRRGAAGVFRPVVRQADGQPTTHCPAASWPSRSHGQGLLLSVVLFRTPIATQVDDGPDGPVCRPWPPHPDLGTAMISAVTPAWP